MLQVPYHSRIRVCFLIAILALCGVPAAWAHRIDAWAHAENGRLFVDVTASSGEAIPGALVELIDSAGTVVKKNRTNVDGRAEFELASLPAEVDVVATTDDGHRAETAFSRVDAVTAPTTATSHAAVHQRSPADRAALDRVGEVLVQHGAALSDIEHRLAEMERPRPGVSRESVVAGLGLIFGLTGLIAAVVALRRASGKDM